MNLNKLTIKMKKLITTILSLTAIILSLQSCGGGSGNNETRDFKTMVIEFQTNATIMGVKTTEHKIQWIDQKNKKEATHTTQETTMMGQTTEEETLEIKDGDWSYTIDLKSKTGTKANTKAIQDMAVSLVSMMDIDEKGLREFVEKSGGKVIGNESFLGKDCLVYEMIGTKQWMYKGIVLKAAMGDKTIIEAVKIEENVKIPADRFKVPEGITITEMPNIF